MRATWWVYSIGMLATGTIDCYPGVVIPRECGTRVRWPQERSRQKMRRFPAKRPSVRSFTNSRFFPAIVVVPLKLLWYIPCTFACTSRVLSTCSRPTPPWSTQSRRLGRVGQAEASSRHEIRWTMPAFALVGCLGTPLERGHFDSRSTTLDVPPTPFPAPR